MFPSVFPHNSGLAIAMVLSMLFLLLLRFIAGVVVWLLIVAVLSTGAFGEDEFSFGFISLLALEIWKQCLFLLCSDSGWSLCLICLACVQYIFPRFVSFAFRDLALLLAVR